MGARLTIADVSSTGGYMGATYFQEFGCPMFLTHPQLVGIHGCNMISGFQALLFFQPDSKMDLDLNISNLPFHGISSQEEEGSSQNDDWKHVPANKVQHTRVIRQCQLRVIQ